MPRAIDDPAVVFIPLEKAATPPAGVIEHLKDRWWASVPDRGILFIKLGRDQFPQCNSSQWIVENMIKRFYPWATAIHVPSVFIPYRE